MTHAVSSLTVETDSHDKGVLVLSLIGRVDGNTLETLEAAVEEPLQAGRQAIIFDLEKMSYVNSAGLRTFLVAARRLQRAGGKAVFCGLADNLAKVFRVSGFDTIFTICETREDALNTF